MYKKISEIQTQLSEFLNTVKMSITLLPKSGQGIVDLFINIPRDPGKSLFNANLYQILGMRLEIQSVINSLIKLSEEIKDHYHLNPYKIFELEAFQHYEGLFKKILERPDIKSAPTEETLTLHGLERKHLLLIQLLSR